MSLHIYFYSVDIEFSVYGALIQDFTYEQFITNNCLIQDNFVSKHNIHLHMHRKKSTSKTS